MNDAAQPAKAESASPEPSLGELIRTRRSVRRFEDRPVPDDLITEILEAGRWAPSPANLQPTRFVLVMDPAIKLQLQELALESKELSSHWDPIFRAGGSSGLVNDMIRPVLIAVCADPAKSLTNIHADSGFEWAAAMSIYAMWLRAHSLGLGAVFVQHWIVEKAKAILDIPLNWTFLGTFTVGYASPAPEGEEAPRRAERLPLEELVFTDRFRP
jgi:nicotinate-nucleotide--dimethylbenzimidazole phosphoribosyltransferase